MSVLTLPEPPDPVSDEEDEPLGPGREDGTCLHACSHTCARAQLRKKQLPRVAESHASDTPTLTRASTSSAVEQLPTQNRRDPLSTASACRGGAPCDAAAAVWLPAVLDVGRRELAARLHGALLPLLVEAAGAAKATLVLHDKELVEDAARVLDLLAPLLFAHGVRRVAVVAGPSRALHVDVKPPCSVRNEYAARAASIA